MQILHGQTVGFHGFIFVTNDKIEWSFLISIDDSFQMTGPKYLKECFPLRTELIEGITNSGLGRKVMVLSLFTNIYLKLLPELSWETLEISVESLWIFWWRVQKDLPLSSNWWNVEMSS